MQRALNSRLLAAASRPVAQRACAPARRFYSANTEPTPVTSPSDKPGAQAGDSSVVSKEGPSEAMAKHNPDYNVVVDYRTSTFSPIPKRVMDGSEPGEVVPAAVLSGAPVDLQARTVRIYKPTKAATQSGDWHSHHWQMDWDPLSKGHRWENPLIGWQSSADFMQGERMFFKSKEDAIAFAEKQGYEYFVQEPNERRIVPKAYANNFLHSPKKLKIIRTK
ncbi:putative nadh-ubiquinone oxidoreductase 18 kda protein [Lasiodiplodia theobromae]|uniref:NADH dehydrogenase [ubiquinone] iron-sulfur protein 4, mitochondrial n=2 Tax=Lasiodiplodia TaxID=66739 RepID=A0A5N5DND1_9PEZI|nr:NADH-ubiquinone oxidoreductase [Lasiodiplodia theobromae]KAB2579439.1 NADH-ubiquinone oxidoreductase 21 kDa subunit [Lasiodiplodia theobromae]KAF4542256.1 NADH-ubiquinone oxidoreductase [Lasiodiplodia theobromae]KAF9635314.1 putative nadh-ubiquinone oxidoreductase 18 kda protein [Lasiodiplodia theobromae]KAK0665043.1 NADH-ubiquinone oxidoreductase 21 kDa subunit [Lasiodiplodia hormozganensis]